MKDFLFVMEGFDTETLEVKVYKSVIIKAESKIEALYMLSWYDLDSENALDWRILNAKEINKIQVNKY